MCLRRWKGKIGDLVYEQKTVFFCQRWQIRISYEDASALEGFLHMSKSLEDMKTIKIEFDPLNRIFSYFVLTFHF
jgi:hypothetical protein